jgi:hypothetical protein
MPFIYALLVLTAFLVGCCVLTMLAFARQLWRTHKVGKSGGLSGMEMGQSVAPLDTSALTPKILRLRSNFICALHSRPHPLPHRSELMMSARQTVAECAYFETGLARGNESVVEEAKDNGRKA